MRTKSLIISILVFGLLSCKSDEKKRYNSLQHVVIIKKTFLEPMTGFETVDSQLHLIGPTNGKIPDAFWEVVYTGNCDLGRFAVIYNKNTNTKTFNYRFGFNDLYHIEITDKNDKHSIYDPENDSVKIVYNAIFKTSKKSEETVMFHYKLGLLCFEWLESPENQAGFNCHLTQQMGAAKAMLIKSPYIRLIPSTLADLRKKRLINEDERVYLNDGNGTAYKYKKVKDISF